MNEHDEQGRPESAPEGQGSGSGQSYGQRPYGSPAPYAQQHDQEQYGQPTYGQPTHAQPAYGQPTYGQQQGYPEPYGQQYTQPYGQYGTPAAPAKPPHVIVPAVLGFAFGAVGVLISLAAIIIGAVASGSSNAADERVPGLGAFAGAIGGALIVVGVLALAWTVLMIWGSVWALTGRSRVLLLVGGSIALFFTGLSFFGNLGNADRSGAGGIVLSLLFFLAALAIVVLLSLPPAAQFFAAHRARRGR
jgi:hypothetical protein